MSRFTNHHLFLSWVLAVNFWGIPNPFQDHLHRVASVYLKVGHVRLFVAHGVYSPWILQERIWEWVAFPFSRRSSQPRDLIQVSGISGRFFTSWATREACQFISTIETIKWPHLRTVKYLWVFNNLQNPMIFSSCYLWDRLSHNLHLACQSGYIYLHFYALFWECSSSKTHVVHPLISLKPYSNVIFSLRCLTSLSKIMPSRLSVSTLLFLQFHHSLYHHSQPNTIPLALSLTSLQRDL